MEAAERLAFEHLRRQPDSAARLLESLAPADAAAVLADAPVRSAAGVLARMLPACALRCAQDLASPRLAAMLGYVPHLHGAALLRGLADDQRAAVLSHVDVTRAAALNLMLLYPESAVGARITPDVLTFPTDLAAGDARKRLRDAGDHAPDRIFVLDRDRFVRAAVRIPQVVAAKKNDRLVDIGTPEPEVVRARAWLADVASLPAWRDFREMPVVNRDNRFVGVLNFASVHPLLSESGGGSHEFHTVPPQSGLAELFITGGSGVWRAWLELLTNPKRGGRVSHD